MNVNESPKLLRALWLWEARRASQGGCTVQLSAESTGLAVGPCGVGVGVNLIPDVVIRHIVGATQ